MQTGIRILTDQDINQVYTSTATYPLPQDLGQDLTGAVGATADGRRFRYANIGGTGTVTAGTFLQQAAAPANSTALAIPTTNTTAQLSSGSTSIIVTNGATAVTQDQFANGYLQVTQTSGATTQAAYRILGNSTASASGAITVQLAPGEALRNTVALVAATDTVNLVYSPWWAVAASSTDLLGAGVLPITSVGASGQYNFAWVQTYGDCLTQLDSVSNGVTAGGMLANSTTTAGSVTAWLGAGLAHGSAQVIGVARATTSASATCSTFLTFG